MKQDQVCAGLRVRDVGQRIDIEGADDTRVQAPEVEHPDVAMQTGGRLEHVPALLRRVHARVVAAHAGRDDAERLELATVQKIE